MEGRVFAVLVLGGERERERENRVCREINAVCYDGLSLRVASLSHETLICMTL